jgi:hypothetical protein
MIADVVTAMRFIYLSPLRRGYVPSYQLAPCLDCLSVSYRIPGAGRILLAAALGHCANSLLKKQAGGSGMFAPLNRHASPLDSVTLAARRVWQ